MTRTWDHPRPVAPATHLTSVAFVQDDLYGFCHRGHCSCGWRGPERAPCDAGKDRARFDGIAHRLGSERPADQRPTARWTKADRVITWTVGAAMAAIYIALAASAPVWGQWLAMIAGAAGGNAIGRHRHQILGRRRHVQTHLERVRPAYRHVRLIDDEDR